MSAANGLCLCTHTSAEHAGKPGRRRCTRPGCGCIRFRRDAEPAAIPTEPT